ncbi:hypothetical protein Fot_05563 [Forsythia ovata]|uniref:Uncharacterized protein n=1 Tax=Forsythia ovata TaxID=205694 RepID=A0ABD1WQJ6_9LAMI
MAGCVMLMTWEFRWDGDGMEELVLRARGFNSDHKETDTDMVVVDEVICGLKMKHRTEKTRRRCKKHITGESTIREIRSSDSGEETTSQHLFMHEDKMASWLHYPLPAVK